MLEQVYFLGSAPFVWYDWGIFEYFAKHFRRTFRQSRAVYRGRMSVWLPFYPRVSSVFCQVFSLVSSGGIKFEILLWHLVYLDGLFLLSNRT